MSVNYFDRKMQTGPDVKLLSVITCPYCKYQKEETMPLNSCMWFYECDKCKSLLKPESGDCCVFCSYGSVRCPPVQTERSCCRNPDNYQ